MTDLQDDDLEQFGAPQKVDLKLSELSNLDCIPLEDLGELDTSSLLSSADSFEISETLDTWSFPLDLEEQESIGLKIWEPFHKKTFQDPRIKFISEGGSQVLDPVLAAQNGEDGEVSGEFEGAGKAAILVSSLFELGLGRNSALYHYEEDEKSFIALNRYEPIPDFSLEAVQNLSTTFMDHGNKTKRLQSFVDVTRASCSSLSTSIALASSIAAIMAKLHAHIESPSKSNFSLLQLQTLFERPGLVLAGLSDIVSKVDATRSEEGFLSWLYEYVQSSDHSAEWIRSILFEVLASVSRPWLDTVSEWIGLTKMTSARCHDYCLSFASAREETRRIVGGKETKKLANEFEPLSMPTFISGQDAQTIYEIGKSLRILENHQPGHPLSRPAQASTMGAPDLSWQFSWQDIERVQLQVQEYESNLRKVIAEFNIHGRNFEERYLPRKSSLRTDITTVGLSEETAKAYIQASIANFERPLPDLTIERENPRLPNGDHKESQQEKTFGPPLALLPVLSFSSLIASQAHLINRSCLHLLFRVHDIQSHFSLLHRFTLFSDGAFTSRLSHALFDPQLDSADSSKRRFAGGLSGLKLGSRDTWPPASSELRLALMSVLTESYFEDGRGAEGPSAFRKELPGGLSFAVRGMPKDELQRCMDPNSIQALDFLRLQYKPPPPLDAVITQASLVKYDVAFKLLLRATRMLFVVNQLYHDTKSRFAIRTEADLISRSFQIESHHFVSAICRYFSNGVQANWEVLRQWLEDTDKALDRDGTGDDGDDSLYQLRDFHETLLDRLMSTLMLEKRHVPVMTSLEDIFSLILGFARYVRTEATDPSGSPKLDLKGSYEEFGKKVRVFIGLCRGLSEGRGEGDEVHHGAGGEFGDDFGQLLLDFDMSGFYAE